MANIPSFEVLPQLRNLAETSIAQARTAFEGFFGVARRTTDTVQGSTDAGRTGAQDLYTRGLDYAEQNVTAALDVAQKLTAARSFPEAAQIQAEYVRERFAAIQAQAKAFGTLAQDAFQQGTDRARAVAKQGAEEAGRAFEQGRTAAEHTVHAAQQAAEQPAP